MDNQRIGSLKKISLGIVAGSASDATDLISTPVSLEIIFGIGKEGLTPLEYALSGKSSGDTVHVVLAREEVPEFFQHNLPLPLMNPKFSDSVHLKIHVHGIASAEARDVIQAMSELSGDCACSCGCGGHGDSGNRCEDQSGCSEVSACGGCGG